MILRIKHPFVEKGQTLVLQRPVSAIACAYVINQSVDHRSSARNGSQFQHDSGEFDWNVNFFASFYRRHNAVNDFCLLFTRIGEVIFLRTSTIQLARIDDVVERVLLFIQCVLHIDVTLRDRRAHFIQIEHFIVHLFSASDRQRLTRRTPTGEHRTANSVWMFLTGVFTREEHASFGLTQIVVIRSSLRASGNVGVRSSRIGIGLPSSNERLLQRRHLRRIFRETDSRQRRKNRFHYGLRTFGFSRFRGVAGDERDQHGLATYWH
mmetsp:Transcript_7856/g.31530  ORF Transcript_7856/g.31530 Transcript_7856/m.31530 type:complete len:265 (+) Transcript_7856:1031-1825(+)